MPKHADVAEKLHLPADGQRSGDKGGEPLFADLQSILHRADPDDAQTLAIDSKF